MEELFQEISRENNSGDLSTVFKSYEKHSKKPMIDLGNFWFKKPIDFIGIRVMRGHVYEKSLVR